MFIPVIFFFSSLLWICKGAFSSDPLIETALYFHDRHQFEESLKLWQPLAKRYPGNVQILLKLADQELWVFGKARARETLLSALRGSAISIEHKLMIRERLAYLNALFLTDEGQSNYLQALSRAKHGDLAKSESLLVTANRAETLNSSVLRQLAKIQAQQNAFDRYTDTLKTLVELEPYEWKSKVLLADAYLHQGRPAVAIPLLKAGLETTRSVALLTRLASAQFEMGDTEIAVANLRNLSRATNPHPIVWYYLGRWSESAKRTSAKRYFHNFLDSSKTVTPETPPDPFRLASRVEEISKRSF